MEHLNTTTPDGVQLNLDALYKICPACFTESIDDNGNLKHVVDWQKLRSFFGDSIDENIPEAYEFTWVGKRDAIRKAASPISKTLRPCPQDSVNWEKTHNIYIEGDNLDVLKLLQNSYMGKVKMIYIDPPYNTGNDFVYKDNRILSEEEYNSSIEDELGRRLIKNTYSNGAFHSDWCSMIYSRLIIARSLLANDGVIFISIDDNEIENIQKICSEIFGSGNCIARMVINRPSEVATDLTVQKHEYCLVYAKNIDAISLCGNKKTTVSRGTVGNIDQTMPTITFPKGLMCKNIPDGTYHQARQIPGSMENIEVITPFIVKNSILAEPVQLRARWRSSNDMRNFFSNNCKPTKAKINGIIEDIYFDGDRFMPYISKSVTEKLPTLYLDNKRGSTDLERLDLNYFDFPKSVSYISFLISLFTQDGDIVLDFFSGSSTTAHAVLQQNVQTGYYARKYIMVQIPEKLDISSKAASSGYSTICELARERIYRAGQRIIEENSLTAQNLDIGFRVFRCDSSNFKNVSISPNDYNQEGLETYLDNIKEDRSDLDLLFDCMLRWGVELSLPISTIKVGHCTIHNVNDGDLVACFDGKITDAVIDKIADMNPLRVVFRDSNFDEASQKMNLFELFKQKCNWTEQEVINNVKVI